MAKYARLTLCLAVMLLGGCMMDAAKLAGFSQPKLKATYNAARGRFDLEAGTDFQGRAEGHYNPDTGQIDAEVEVGSIASPVVKAEGDRAESLVALRKIEADMLVKMHEVARDNIAAGVGLANNITKAVVKDRDESSTTIVETIWAVVWGVAILAVVLVGGRLAWGLVKPRA